MVVHAAIHVDLAELPEIVLSLLFHGVFGWVVLAGGFFVIFMLGSGRPVPYLFTHKFNRKKTKYQKLIVRLRDLLLCRMKL
jgi:hypothetical protein